MLKNVMLLDGVRTPFGKHAGALARIRPDDLAAMAITALRERLPIPADKVDDVIFGCTNQAGEDSRNVARHAALLAGLPVTVPGRTVNRLCASGLQAAIDAAHGIACGAGQVFLAGGVESMSRAPFVMAKSEAAFGREVQVFDSTLGARFPNPRFLAQFGAHTMPETAEEVAREGRLTREACDAFALRSQQRYEAARQRGFFDGEITSVTLAATRKGQDPVVVARDEHPRADTTPATLAKLKTLQEGGVVTAGNASGINDGACAVWLASADASANLGLSPLAEIIATAAAGVEPRVMGLGPVTAIQRALAMASLSLKDMDVIEINEAFAAQVLGCLQLLSLPADDARVNPNGGAIAVGHPLGASGARLLLTAARQLRETGGRYACVSLCIGVGQGLAVIIKRPG